MKNLAFLSIFFSFLWFGHMSPSAPVLHNNPYFLPGALSEAREDGVVYTISPIRTIMCHEGIYSVVTGHGMSNTLWKDALRVEYRAQKNQPAKFDGWFQSNQLHRRLDPFELCKKMSARLTGDLLALPYSDINQPRVLQILGDIDREIDHAHKPLSLSRATRDCSASVAFAFLKGDRLVTGACGENVVWVFAGVSREEGWLPSSYYYALPLPQGINQGGIGSSEFNKHSGAVTVRNINATEKQFVVLMNKAVRNCFTQEQIAEIYRVESYKEENLGHRVSKRLLDIARRIYERMASEWESKKAVMHKDLKIDIKQFEKAKKDAFRQQFIAQAEDQGQASIDQAAFLNAWQKIWEQERKGFEELQRRQDLLKARVAKEKGMQLETPELSVMVLPIGQPFLNGKTEEFATAELNVMSKHIVRDFNVNNLLDQCQKTSLPDKKLLIQRVDTVFSRAGKSAIKREKKGFLDKCIDYIANPYFLGSVIASCISYYFYKTYLK